jgi:hypothetical protein
VALRGRTPHEDAEAATPKTTSIGHAGVLMVGFENSSVIASCPRRARSVVMYARA